MDRGFFSRNQTHRSGGFVRSLVFLRRSSLSLLVCFYGYLFHSVSSSQPSSTSLTDVSGVTFGDVSEAERRLQAKDSPSVAFLRQQWPESAQPVVEGTPRIGSDWTAAYTTPGASPALRSGRRRRVQAWSRRRRVQASWCPSVGCSTAPCSALCSGDCCSPLFRG